MGLWLLHKHPWLSPHLTHALNTTSFFQLISQTWQVSVLLTQRLTLSPLPHTTSPSTKSSPGPTKRLWQKPCVFLFSLTEWRISQHWQTSCQIPRKETRSILAQTLHRQPSLGVHCSWSAYHSWCPQLQPWTEGAPSHILFSSVYPTWEMGLSHLAWGSSPGSGHSSYSTYI